MMSAMESPRLAPDSEQLVNEVDKPHREDSHEVHLRNAAEPRQRQAASSTASITVRVVLLNWVSEGHLSRSLKRRGRNAAVSATERA